jgi:tRNA (cytidine/uridine-2'-O-)-methyltransferase
VLNVVLVAPEIPPNTGNIGRLCLAAGARLHLVKPLGFRIDDATLRRAGLDYWVHLDWKVWESWDDLRAAGLAESPAARWWFFTTKTKRCLWEASFRDGDWLVFGRETRGLPEELLAEHEPQCLTLPMSPLARSLNLSNAVAVGLYEALRQQAADGGDSDGVGPIAVSSDS